MWDKLQRAQKIMVLIGARRKRFAFWADCGMGKTLTAITLAKYFRKTKDVQQVLVLVPRRTNKEEWADEIKKHSPKTKYLILPESIEAKWASLEKTDALIVVETYMGFVRMLCRVKKHGKKKVNRLVPVPSLIKRAQKLFQGTILDECFVAGTSIATTQGSASIESLTTQHRVLTSTGSAAIRRILKKRTQIVSRIVLVDGRVILSTPNHPFLTKRGWICAGNLEGEHVISRDETLRLVQKTVHGTVPIMEQNEAILRDIVLCEMENETTRNTREGVHSRTIREVASYIDQEQHTQGQMDPDVERQTSSESVARQSKCNEERAPVGCSSWWEWHWSHRTAATFAESIRPSLETGARHFIRGKATWLSNLLQGRFSLPEQKMGDRVRWRRPSRDEKAKAGPKKGSEVIGVRVACVETIQLKNPIDVFDLELEGTPHFCAEGVVVHNSIHAKNKAKLPYRVCRKMAQSCSVFFALTATPFGRDPTDLWGQMYFIDFGHSLGDTLGLFRKAFFKERVNFWGRFEYSPDKAKEPLMHRALAHSSIRFEADEADLPGLVPVMKKLTLPHEAEAYYQKAQEALRTAGNFREMKNSFMRMRQISSGFIGFKDDDTGQKASYVFEENPKLEALLSVLESISGEHKAIVFHDFIYSGQRISDELTKMNIEHVRLYGGTKDVRAARDRFNKDSKCRVLLLQNSFGEGLNLQVARYLLFYESPVSCIMRKQCERRAHRQHSKFKTVFMYDFLVKDTMDVRIREFHTEGRDLFQAIINGEA
jgi:hypothetical protein